jgi:ketosteroid isomerase-like protein
MSKEHVDLARQGVENWNRGDVDAMIESSTPDFEFTPAVADGVEGGGAVHGPDEFRRFFAGLNETWESFRIEAEDFQEIGERVLIRGNVVATGRASGIELDQPIFAVCSFQGGKGSRMHTFLDETAALDAASKEVVR